MNIPAKVFISYSHKDEKYKDQLITHLSPLKALGLVEEWNDRMLVPGSVLHDVIDINLSNSDIILLLISSDYVSSYSCYKDEFPKAFNKWKNGTALIVPIIVRETASWTDLQFGKFTALPQDGKAICNYKNRDKAFSNVVEGIKKLIQSLQIKKDYKFIQCPKCGSTNIEITTKKFLDNFNNDLSLWSLKLSFTAAIKLGKTGILGKETKKNSRILDSNIITFKCLNCNNIIESRENIY